MKVWREGFAPQFSIEQLKLLKKALDEDDASLLQGATCYPPPLECVQNWPCEGACLIGYAGWKGNNLDTVGEVENFFAIACYEGDQLLGEPAACRHLLNWFDDTPRDKMRAALSAELAKNISDREKTC